MFCFLFLFLFFNVLNRDFFFSARSTFASSLVQAWGWYRNGTEKSVSDSQFLINLRSISKTFLAVCQSPVFVCGRESSLTPQGRDTHIENVELSADRKFPGESHSSVYFEFFEFFHDSFDFC